MSTPLSPSAAAALRSATTEPTPRLATNGLTSPGAVAGQFAAMLATLRDAMADAAGGTAEIAAMGVSQPAGAATAATGKQTENGEHRVATAAVSLLLQDMGNDAPVGDVDGGGSRRRPATADVSGQVLQTTVDGGAPTDGRWMAMLMNVGTPAAG